MSIGSLGWIGSLAATPLPQKAAETDMTRRQASDHAREVQAAQAAEVAAGIGETQEDRQAAERDPDGRLAWEAAVKSRSDEATPDAGGAAILSQEPGGGPGQAVDLVG